MPETEQTQLDLGLAAPRESDSPMVKACHRTLEALAADGKLSATSSLLAQLLLELSGAIDRGRAAGRASAVAMAARELRDTLLMLDPPPEDGAAGDKAREALEAFMAQAEAWANTGQAPAPWAT